MDALSFYAHLKENTFPRNHLAANEMAVEAHRKAPVAQSTRQGGYLAGGPLGVGGALTSLDVRGCLSRSAVMQGQSVGRALRPRTSRFCVFCQ